MQIQAVRTRVLVPPQDDLLEAIVQSDLAPNEGDCIAVSSKAVSIWEGRCVPVDHRNHEQRDVLAKGEATEWIHREHVPGRHAFWTLTNNLLISGAGIDASNANDHFVLWPACPHKSASELHARLCEHFGLQTLAIIITDSHSTPLRRGALGFALGWAGFDPLIDHRGKPDLFGRMLVSEHTNLADSLAAAAVLAMGETNECTPLAVLRNVPQLAQALGRAAHHEPPFELTREQDIYAPFLLNALWQHGADD